MFRPGNSLDHYLWKTILLWGTCVDHFEKVKESIGKNKVIHLTIATIKLIPIISRIASLFEWAIVRSFQAKKVEPLLNNRVNVLGAPYRWANIQDILSHCEYLYDNKYLQNYRDFRYFVCTDEVLNAKVNPLFSELSYYINESLTKNILFFLPLISANHWHLIVINPYHRNIEHYDSLGKDISPAVQNCIDEINNLIEIYSKERYPFITSTEIQQKNNYDCGVFISYYMEECIKGKSFSEIRTLSADYLKSRISRYRQIMYSRLCREFTGKDWLPSLAT